MKGNLNTAGGTHYSEMEAGQPQNGSQEMDSLYLVSGEVILSFIQGLKNEYREPARQIIADFLRGPVQPDLYYFQEEWEMVKYLVLSHIKQLQTN